MRQHEYVVPNAPMSIAQYLKEIPSSIRENVPFRAMILTCMFLVVANSLLPYYTLYALRVFSATESHIAAFAALAVLSVAFAHVVFGAVVDRQGPKITLLIATLLVISAGVLALTTNSLSFLFLVWVLANLGNTCYLLTASLIIGEVSPSTKLPLYVGVQNIISLALSSLVLLLLAPLIENIGFVLLFVAVFACGLFSLLINMFVLRKAMSNQATAA
jgi:MFS family permease